MRIVQFLLIYLAGLGMLFSAKYLFHLSDYLIPPPGELFGFFKADGSRFLAAALNTALVAVAGHGCSLVLAAVVAFLSRRATLLGQMVKTAAYNLQAYPVVALAPIVFIFLGDGLASRLLIAAIICYFPLLLSFLGVFSTPVEEVELFYSQTGRLTPWLEVRIRLFENLQKIATVVAGSSTLAMVGTIVAEFLAASNGIGYSIRKALYQNNLSAILTALFCIGLLSSAYFWAIEQLGESVRRRLSG